MQGKTLRHVIPKENIHASHRKTAHIVAALILDVEEAPASPCWHPQLTIAPRLAHTHMNSAPLPPAAAASHSNASDGGQLPPPIPDSNYKRHLASPSPGVEDTPSSTQKVQQQQQQQQQEQLCVASSSSATTSPVHTALIPTANGNTQQPATPSHPDLLLPNNHAQPTTPSSLSWKPMMPR